jgi:hypothetical protein
VILEYNEIKAMAEDVKTASLLLGNGFSIALDSRFNYQSLFDRARENGLNERTEKLFARVGRGDFEGALRVLDDGEWIAKTYDLAGVDIDELQADGERIRAALAAAVKDSHIDHAGDLDANAARSARRFLAPYRSVFTTNYDLLLYWVVMSMKEAARLDDGFRFASGDPIFAGWDSASRSMHHLHGALHFYWDEEGLRKHSWRESGHRLKDAIADGLKGKRYPHIVAEGLSEKKLGKIRRSHYLSACYERLKLATPLVVSLGFSFADNDEHIAIAIANNASLTRLCVGLHGDPDNASNRGIMSRVTRAIEGRNKALSKLEVSYFDSASASPWAAAPPRG